MSNILGIHYHFSRDSASSSASDLPPQPHFLNKLVQFGIVSHSAVDYSAMSRSLSPLRIVPLISNSGPQLPREILPIILTLQASEGELNASIFLNLAAPEFLKVQQAKSEHISYAHGNELQTNSYLCWCPLRNGQSAQELHQQSHGSAHQFAEESSIDCHCFLIRQ